MNIAVNVGGGMQRHALGFDGAIHVAMDLDRVCRDRAGDLARLADDHFLAVDIAPDFAVDQQSCLGNDRDFFTEDDEIGADNRDVAGLSFRHSSVRH